MSRSSNPQNINLEFLRKQAKALLRECRIGNLEALTRIRAQLPSAKGSIEFKLADVHHALARELGFPNWAALKRHDDPVERFLIAIRSGALKAAQHELREFPEMAQECIHAACAIGDPETAANHLSLDPGLAKAEHRGWPPLLYACASPLNKATARQSAGIVECARLLLDHGVDPNTAVPADPRESERKLTATYRALMSVNMPVMNLLMQRGASMPDFKERAEVIKRERPLLSDAFHEYFQSPPVRQRMDELRTQASDSASQKWWYHARPDFSAVAAYAYRPLLERKLVDPNKVYQDGLTVFQHIVRRGNTEAVEMFLQRGADIDRPAPDGRTPLVLAIRAGN